MAAAEIDVGTILGDTYEITQLIGQGGMGAVWAAKHKRLPKRFAVKVLLGALMDSEGYARFRREAETTSKIGHPNIVEVLDFNTLASGTPYLVMEFFDGESLAKRIKRGPLKLEEALGLTRQIGSALHAAHKNDVVHRDLKPDNIYLCPSDSGGVIGDRVKVLDFGISKIKNAATVLTQESTLMGTPQYMSPEQASGKNSLVDQRTDVFALGAIVYEMLTGNAAFSGETLATVVVKVMLEPPPPIEELTPSIPKPVREAVYRALEKDPAKRFPDVGSFVGALTGSPLQTLDRRPVGTATPVVNPGFLPTEAGTPLPPTNPGPTDAYAATGAGTPIPGSLARGEVAIPTEPVRKKKGSMLWVGVAAGVVLLGGGAVVMMKMGDHKPVVAEQPKPPVDVQPKPPVDVQPKPPVDVQPKPPTEMVVAANTKPPGETASDVAKPTVEAKTAAHAAKAEALPAEVVAELQEAEKALSSGDAREAIRLARHTLLAKTSGRAFAVITRAQCKQGDLGGAKASFHSVDKGELARVKRDCKAAGIDL